MFNEVSDKFFISSFISLIKKTPILKVGETFIEIPNVAIFSTKNTILHQFLNPGMDILYVNKKELDRMKGIIESNSSKLEIALKTKPKGKLIINFEQIINTLILFKSEESILKINNIIFTSDKMEFHGSSLAGNEIYFVPEEDLKIIEEVFLAFCSA